MTFIKNLTAGTRFAMDNGTVYVAQDVRTMGNLTRVTYHREGTPTCSFTFAKVNLTTVKVL